MTPRRTAALLLASLMALTLVAQTAPSAGDKKAPAKVERKTHVLWPDGAPPTKVDWHEGSVFVPPDFWWHQHFNAGAIPARYLAIRWGSVKHKLDDKYSRLDQDRATGGNQIEYADEDPAVRARFESELSKEGVQSRMPAVARR